MEVVDGPVARPLHLVEQALVDVSEWLEPSMDVEVIVVVHVAAVGERV